MLSDRTVVLWLLLLAIAAACTRLPTGNPAPSADVVTARRVLGEPLVALVQSVVTLSQDLDALRHEVERGRPMRQGAKVVREDIRAVRTAGRAALDATRKSPVAEAATVVSESVTDALAAASAAQAELSYLRALERIDSALLAIVAAWDEPGSQSEQRERLDAELETVRLQRGALKAVRPQPAGCRVMVANRRRWISVVSDRTRVLLESADSAGGERYDELRDAYRRTPFAEDPEAADAKDRACWKKRSDVPTTSADLRARVEQLQKVLG